jgi:hypothetical protein
MAKLTLNFDNVSQEHLEHQDKYREIFAALMTSGGLTGVKSGQTVIHFDMDANFMGVQLNYWPFRKRKQ